MKSEMCEILTRGGWTLVEQSTSDEHGCNVELLQYQTIENHFYLLFDGKVMMDSIYPKSEKVLSSICLERFQSSREPHILIGGLGFGYTLEETLKRVGSGSEITVAEISSDIISWNRDHVSHLSNNSIEDSRVTIYNGDVLDKAVTQWDIILLDVDNGTAEQLLTRNNSVYSSQGLQTFSQSIKSDGVLGVWSCGEDTQLLQNMTDAGLDVEIVKVDSGPHHIYVGTKS